MGPCPYHPTIAPVGVRVMTLAATPRELNDHIKAGRDANGRFATGNTLGKGNPFARRVAALREALFEEIDETKFRKMVKDLCEMALSKDLAAMKLVLLYMLGKSDDMVNPDDLDRLEYEQLKRDKVHQKEVMAECSAHVPAKVANTMLQLAVPMSGQMNIDLLHGKPVPPGPLVEPMPPRPGDEGKAGPEGPPETVPFPTVTTRERRPEHAANEGRSVPTARRAKNRRKKGRGKRRA